MANVAQIHTALDVFDLSWQSSANASFNVFKAAINNHNMK